MEVSLPISDGVEERRAPSRPESKATRQHAEPVLGAPSVSLPLRFVLTGMLSLFVGVGWLVARPGILATYHYNQYVIAVTVSYTHLTLPTIYSV